MKRQKGFFLSAACLSPHLFRWAPNVASFAACSFAVVFQMISHFCYFPQFIFLQPAVFDDIGTGNSIHCSIDPCNHCPVSQGRPLQPGQGYCPGTSQFSLLYLTIQHMLLGKQRQLENGKKKGILQKYSTPEFYLNKQRSNILSVGYQIKCLKLKF